MKFSDLINKVVSLAVTYRDITINISFFSEKFSPTYKAQLAKLIEEQLDISADAKMLSDLLESWDITDDDGQPMKPTYDVLVKMPYSLLVKLGQAIFNYIGDTTNPTQPTSSQAS